MHIAVVSLGAFGHVNPTLELVTELVHRGGAGDLLLHRGVPPYCGTHRGPV